MDMYFWVFPVAEMKKKCVKNEKKGCRNCFGLLPKLCHDTMGKLYRDLLYGCAMG